MPVIQQTTIPYFRRVECSTTYQTIELLDAAATVDIIFEDSSGKATMGQLTIGADNFGGTPAATDPRTFGWSWLSQRRPAPQFVNFAHPSGVGHYFSILVS